MEEAILKSIVFINDHKNYLTGTFLCGISGLIFLGLVPLKIQEDGSNLDAINVILRRFLLFISFIILPIFIFYVYAMSNKLFGSNQFFKAFFEETVIGFEGSYFLYAAVFTATFTIKFTYNRVVIPRWSAFIRKYRIKQNDNELSDIRSELSQMQSKDYDPRKYFKNGFMFFGLDDNDQPIYETDDDFKKRHMKFVGPSQTGKGVIQGLIIYQVIIKGWVCGFFDIKPDDFIYSIMCKACKDAGRPTPVVVDLNGVGPGSYNMFTNGTDRDILSRIQAAVNVNEKGTNADFYNANERSLMIDIQEFFDGSLKTLEKLLKGDLPNGEKKPEYYDITQKSRAYVKEMKSHKPLNPKKGRGFSVDKTLQAGAVFYVRGSITDKLVKKAQTILLMDIIQSVIRLGKQKEHFYLAIDEVKFIVSDMLSTGLSTVLSKGMNMSVAYQTPANLLSLEDTTLNAKAIKSEIEVNTLTTLSYRAADDETAEWAASLTGTTNKTIVKSEEIDYDTAGAETYTGRKQTTKEQEELIPPNRMKALPIRCGALMRPNALAKVVYTCWIPLAPEDVVDIIPKTLKEEPEAQQEPEEPIEPEAQQEPEEPMEPEAQQEPEEPMEPEAQQEPELLVYSRTSTDTEGGVRRHKKNKDKKGDMSIEDFLKEAGIE